MTDWESLSMCPTAPPYSSKVDHSKVDMLGVRFKPVNLRILVYLVIHDSGQVSREHLLLSRYPSQEGQRAQATQIGAPTQNPTERFLINFCEGRFRCWLMLLSQPFNLAWKVAKGLLLALSHSRTELGFREERWRETNSRLRALGDARGTWGGDLDSLGVFQDVHHRFLPRLPCVSR